MASCLALLLAGHDILSSDTREIQQRWPQHGRGGSAARSKCIAIFASSSALGGALARLNFEHMGQMPAHAQGSHNTIPADLSGASIRAGGITTVALQSVAGVAAAGGDDAWHIAGPCSRSSGCKV
jgi:hypothetical protein